jgi:hypothetical protein
MEEVMASTALAEDLSWEYAGRIGVDTGMVIVGDPRYFATPDADEHPAKDWKAFLRLLRRSRPMVDRGAPFCAGYSVSLVRDAAEDRRQKAERRD